MERIRSACVVRGLRQHLHRAAEGILAKAGSYGGSYGPAFELECLLVGVVQGYRLCAVVDFGWKGDAADPHDVAPPSVLAVDFRATRGGRARGFTCRSKTSSVQFSVSWSIMTTRSGWLLLTATRCPCERCMFEAWRVERGVGGW